MVVLEPDLITPLQGEQKQHVESKGITTDPKKMGILAINNYSYNSEPIDPMKQIKVRSVKANETPNLLLLPMNSAQSLSLIHI